MDKINTLFIRGDDFKVTPTVMPGCEWVLDGHGYATEKLDGTNVMVVFHQDGTHTVHKRKNPNREQKKIDIQPTNIPVDPDNKNDQFSIEAIENFIQANPNHNLNGVKYGEAIGPKINGNRYELDERTWIPFTPPFITVLNMPRSYYRLKSLLTPDRESFAYPGHPIEGVVFHTWHAKAKIKVQDFHKVPKNLEKKK